MTGGEAQRFEPGADIPGDWWTLFHSAPLNALITEALAHNHDLKAARSGIGGGARDHPGAARRLLSAGLRRPVRRAPAESGALAPTPSSNAFTYSLITPSLNIAYTPDVFGLQRRTGELLRAQEAAVRYQLVAAHLTLTSNVVAAAVQEASLQGQIDATRQLIDLDTKAVEILKYQLAKGYANRLDLAAQESQLAQMTATLPQLLKQQAQQRDLLAVLVGRFPSQAPDGKFDLAALTLPTDLPLSLPSRLVEQRPDVLQAEEQPAPRSPSETVAEQLAELAARALHLPAHPAPPDRPDPSDPSDLRAAEQEHS